MVFPQFSGVVLLDSVLPNERSSMGRRGYPPEFRRKVLDLVEAGRPIAEVAQALGSSDQSISSWRRQDRIDRRLEPGLTSGEQAELAVATRRIAELETERQAMRRAMAPKGRFQAVAVLAAEHLPVEVACRVLDVSTSG
jgi:transposase-like protein